MVESDIIDTGIPMPRIAAIHCVDPHRRLVRVVWSEGERQGFTDDIDLSPLIDRFKVFEPIRNNPELFATVYLPDDEEGFVIAWGEGGDLEMSVNSLERLCRNPP